MIETIAWLVVGVGLVAGLVIGLRLNARCRDKWQDRQFGQRLFGRREFFEDE